MNIKDFVKDGNKVYFDSYRQGHFYYNVSYGPSKYQFPVPLEDIGTATLLSEDKALTFMRYIRKAIDGGTFILLDGFKLNKNGKTEIYQNGKLYSSQG